MMDCHRKEQLLQIIEDNKDDTLPSIRTKVAKITGPANNFQF